METVFTEVHVLAWFNNMAGISKWYLAIPDTESDRRARVQKLSKLSRKKRLTDISDDINNKTTDMNAYDEVDDQHDMNMHEVNDQCDMNMHEVNGDDHDMNMHENNSDLHMHVQNENMPVTDLSTIFDFTGLGDSAYGKIRSSTYSFFICSLFYIYYLTIIL